MTPTPTPVRLNKWLADQGVCTSRREADRWIEDGRVTVNKKVATLGTTITPEVDKVRVNNKAIAPQRINHRYWVLNKPKDVIVTRHDPEGRKGLYDILPPACHGCDPAGRLDRQSSGLLILSNDGALIYRLTHPRYALPKVYRVTLDKPLLVADGKQLITGVMLDPEGLARMAEVEMEDPTTLVVTLETGLNRQIRRMLGALGYDVLTLKRIRIGPIRLGTLKLGECRPLRPTELAQLKQQLGFGDKKGAKKSDKKATPKTTAKAAKPSERKAGPASGKSSAEASSWKALDKAFKQLSEKPPARKPKR